MNDTRRQVVPYYFGQNLGCQFLVETSLPTRDDADNVKQALAFAEELPQHKQDQGNIYVDDDALCRVHLSHLTA